MAKLYPPYLEGTLPAFCLNTAGDGVLTIPFAHNKAVDARNQVCGIAVKVKTVQNDVLITSFTTSNTSGIYTDNENGSGQVVFTVSDFVVNGVKDWTIAIGQYYKIQIAYLYIGSKEIGYYSTVGVIKCTSTPEVTIVGFDKDKVNNNSVEFVGQFKQDVGGDVTEKVYSSVFEIKDLNKNIIATSGDVLHNVENNPNSYMSQDIMSFNRDLNFGEIYQITYTVTTTNGLVISSPDYLITQQRSLLTELKGKLIASLNYDEGYIDLSLKGYVDDDGIEEIGNGSFLLSREDSVNPGVWEELCRFALRYESPSKTIFRDFTIEQGKTYVYSIQQYNGNKIYSDRKKSNSIYADFEDIFIYDGEQQLKLRFNPQVSSFKTQLSETRSETIGSKYPFFFRNARIGYKTFPVSGLISMESDENQFFTSFKSILKQDYTADRHDPVFNKRLMPNPNPHTEPRPENYVSERLFKMKVLDWLNNGKVKMFKSSSEGNFLVRFMDTSLSPENALGRMLHNVSTTAYECADYTYANMVKFGIIEDTSANETTVAAYVRQWKEMDIGGYEFTATHIDESNPNNPVYYSDNLLQADIDQPFTSSIRLMDYLPGTKFRFIFDSSGDYEADNHVDIVIGATGNYYADDVEKVYGIYIMQNVSDTPNAGFDEGQNPPKFISGGGTILYEYDVPARNMYDLITNIQTDIGGYEQLVGSIPDVLDYFNDVRRQITEITMSNYHKRPIEFLFYKAGSNIITGDLFAGLDPDGYRSINLGFNLYWDSNFSDDEIFDDKESMNYSPFSLYVLRNSIVNKQDILEHLYTTFGKEHTEEEKEEITHQIDHMFEKYYIDKYLYAHTPEEVLTEQTSLWKVYAKQKGIDEAEIARARAIAERNGEIFFPPEVTDSDILLAFLEENPLYVLDAWNGAIYKVGDWLYDPSIIYNGEKIDLREILDYSLDEVEVDGCVIQLGNGVYAEFFFQDAVKTFQLETDKLDIEVTTAKALWENAVEELKSLILTDDFDYKAIVEQKELVQNTYASYVQLLTSAVENWTARVEEEE